MAEEVAALMAKELDFDLSWQKTQVELYQQLVRNYI
jgi:hypothetical protein